MTEFSFRLETVMKLRKVERDQSRAALAQAVDSLERIEQRIDVINAELRALAQAQPAGRAAVDVERALWSNRYAISLRQGRERCEHDHHAQSAVVTARREELAVADQEFRKLEILRDRRQAQFFAADQQRQQRAMDEIATQAVGRNRGD